MRASLGMPLIPVDAPQAQQKRPRENDGGEPPAKKVKEATEEEKRELAKAIEKAKTKRVMKKFNESGFEATYGKASSVSDWVNQSRNLAETGGRVTEYEIEKERKAREKAKYEAADLAHIQVAHDADKLEMGESILTLADSRVLDNQGDVLENDMIVRNDIARRNKIRRGEMDKNDVDADKYGDRTNSMLTKYDEEAPKDIGFNLSNTALKNESDKVKMTIQQKLNEAAKIRTTDSLNIGYGIESDFMTQEEMEKLGTFRKRKKKKKKKKKDKKVARRIKKDRINVAEDEDEDKKKEKAMVINEEGKFKSNYPDLKPLPKQKRNRGKRGAAERLIATLNSAEELEKQKARYERALREAELNSFMVENESDDDLDLQLSMKRASNLDHTNRNQEEASVASVVENAKKAKKERQRKVEEEKMEKDKNAFVFTTASHFARSLQDAHLQLDEDKKRGDDEDDIRIELDQEELTKEERMEMAKKSLIDNGPLVKMGLAQSMKYACNRGFHKDANFDAFAGVKENRLRPIDVSTKKKLPFLEWTNAQVCQWASQNEFKPFIPTFKRLKLKGLDMSATESVMRTIWKFTDVDVGRWRSRIGEMTGDFCPEIQLTYTGTDGRPMTMSDAFRSMSHIFHGKKPGQKNTEKRLRHHQSERIRKTNVDITDTPLGTIDRMTEVMSVDAKPYIVMEGDNSIRFAKGQQENDLHILR